MPDFNEFPLDIARLCNDTTFFEYLLLRKSTKVKDSYIFAKWICKTGQFEFLDLFVDLSKLKLLRSGDSYHANEFKNYWMTECILYYTIANNRLDLFKKFGEDRFEKKISEIYFVEDNNFRVGTPISIGRIAVKHSNIETIKELYGKFSFFEPIHSGWSNYKQILDVHCFRDKETTSFFFDKMMVDSIFGLLYWGKNEILQGLIESNINFCNIYLSSLREFFKPENNSIFEFLASVNSFSLIKLLPKTNNCEFVPSIYRNNWATIYPSSNSVLESCLIQNNFILFSKMFSICIEKESIESYDACRLLFMVYKYNESQEVEDFLPLLLKFISPTDLRMLLGVACILENKRLLEYLITQIKDINLPFDIEPTLFGLETYHGQAKKITQEYKRGTLLHLWLITHSVLYGTCLNYETIEKLLTSGLDKTIKDELGKVAFDCITYRDFSNKNELLKLLYFEGIKICENNGNLRAIFQNVELPIVETFKSHLKSGINAIEAYRTQNKELLSYFISCGADINTLKEILESEESRKMGIDKDTDSSEYDDDDDDNYGSRYSKYGGYNGYDDDTIDSAFEGDPEATWNID